MLAKFLKAGDRFDLKTSPTGVKSYAVVRLVESKTDGKVTYIKA